MHHGWPDAQRIQGFLDLWHLPRDPNRSYGVRQFPKTLLQVMHCAVAKKLPVPVPRPAKSKAMFAYPPGVHPDSSNQMPPLQ